MMSLTKLRTDEQNSTGITKFCLSVKKNSASSLWYLIDAWVAIGKSGLIS